MAALRSLRCSWAPHVRTDERAPRSAVDSDTRTAAKEKLRARASAVGVPPRTRNFSAGLGPRSCGAEDSEAMRSGGPRPAPAQPRGSSSSRLPSPPGSLCLQLRQRPWLASSLRSQRAIDEPGKRHTAITAYGMWSRQLQRRTITSSAVARTSSSFNSITRMKSWHRGSSLQEGMD